MRISPLPKEAKKFFWDVNISAIDPRRHQRLITERILEYGSKETVQWLMKNVPRRVLKDVLKNSRSLSPKSAYFWGVVLGVKPNSILCLKKPFRQKRSRHWIW